MNTIAIQTVEQNAEILTDLAKKIWENPETAFNEVKACEWTAEVLKNAGYKAENESGVVYIQEALSPEQVDDVHRIRQEAGYVESFGYKRQAAKKDAPQPASAVHGRGKKNAEGPRSDQDAAKKVSGARRRRKGDP